MPGNLDAVVAALRGQSGGLTGLEDINQAQGMFSPRTQTDLSPKAPDLTSFEPTWRDHIAQALMGPTAPSPANRRFVEGLTGSTGLGMSGSPGLLDATPVAPLIQAQEAAQAGDPRAMVLAAVPGGPAARNTVRAIHATLPGAAYSTLDKAFPFIAQAGIGLAPQ